MIRNILLALLFTSAFSLIALPIPQTDALESELERYYSAAEQGNTDEALEAIREAHYLIVNIYGDASPNHLNIDYLYANQLLEAGKKEKAQRFYERLIEERIEEFGELDLGLVDLYIKTSRTYRLLSPVSLLSQGLNIASEIEDLKPFTAAMIQLDIGRELIKFDKVKARVLFKAKSYLDDTLPEGNIHRLTANIDIADYYLFMGKYSKAANILKENVRFFSTNKHQFYSLEYTTRANLVRALHEIGKYDEATEHCLAISRSENLSEEPKRIYFVPPSLPLSVKKNGLSALVVAQFTVDTKGYVTHPTIISNGGTPIFAKSVKVALTKWRYAPLLVGGQAVEAVVTVEFDFGRWKIMGMDNWLDQGNLGSNPMPIPDVL